jgi:hypothetical protein
LALSIVALMGVTSLIAVIGRSTASKIETQAYQENLSKLGDGPLWLDTSDNEPNFLATLTYRLHAHGTRFEMAARSCVTSIDLQVAHLCKGRPD